MEMDLGTLVERLQAARKSGKCADCRYFFEVVLCAQEASEEVAGDAAARAAATLEEWLVESQPRKIHKRLSCNPCPPGDLSRKYGY